MTDLFSPKRSSKATSAYSAEDIQVLEGLEPVRHRPGMYIGGTDERALHHLVAEILDNSMDEAVAGFASIISLHLASDQTLTVQDNGRGIPIDPHPKYPEKSALEVILTTLHAGGKFKEGAYQTAGGLHGVGLSVVNALTSWLEVTVVREKKAWRQFYAQGVATSSLESLRSLPFPQGTSISFRPDPEIFGEAPTFKAATLYKMAKAKAFLHKGVRIRWSCEGAVAGSTPLQEEFYFPQGLGDYLADLVGKATVVTPEPFYGLVHFPDGGGRVEWAIAWTPEQESHIQSFCNTIPTPLGGTHEAGLRTAMTRAFKNFGDLIKNKKASTLTAEDVFAEATVLLSVFVKDPQFQGQTKEKLVSHHAGKLVESSLKDFLDHYLVDHNESAQKVLDFMIERAAERVRLKQMKETQRKTATQRLRLPGKLADCSRQRRDGCELFLVEGDSAGGTAKQARDRETQAVLPLKGKILNVANAQADKIHANQEIQNVVQALGAGMGKDFEASKLRYDRIIIMTDADVDGAHIAALILTFFFQKMRPLIEEGHLFLAEPPLYRLTAGLKSCYAPNEEEKERLLRTTFKGQKVEISRFKGLGEMSAAQLKETTMNKEKRRLTQVELPPDGAQVEQFVEDLMGKIAQKRYEFIQLNAPYAQDLDI